LSVARKNERGTDELMMLREKIVMEEESGVVNNCKRFNPNKKRILERGEAQ
jgi:hypothetical protein